MREILSHQDHKYKRNPVHYACMSKYSNCFKTLEMLLDLRLDEVPAQDQFIVLFRKLQIFEIPEETFDPRRCMGVLGELKKFMRLKDF